MERLAFALLVFPLVSVFAELAPENLPEDLKPVEESFAGDALPNGWKKGPGSWEVAEGVLTGKEVPADEHGGVLTYPKAFTDGAIRFRFKVDEARMFALSFNHAKGHLMRVALAPGEVKIIKDKNKKDPRSKPETLATAQVDDGFADGEWHTVLCEIVGEKISVRVDDTVVLEASNPAFDQEKAGHRFVIGKGTVIIDDVVVWE